MLDPTAAPKRFQHNSDDCINTTKVYIQVQNAVINYVTKTLKYTKPVKKFLKIKEEMKLVKAIANRREIELLFTCKSFNALSSISQPAMKSGGDKAIASLEMST